MTKNERKGYHAEDAQHKTESYANLSGQELEHLAANRRPDHVAIPQQQR